MKMSQALLHGVRVAAVLWVIRRRKKGLTVVLSLNGFIRHTLRVANGLAKRPLRAIVKDQIEKQFLMVKVC